MCGLVYYFLRNKENGASHIRIGCTDSEDWSSEKIHYISGTGEYNDPEL